MLPRADRGLTLAVQRLSGLHDLDRRIVVLNAARVAEVDSQAELMGETGFMPTARVGPGRGQQRIMTASNR